jgi:hypothetical protein
MQAPASWLRLGRAFAAAVLALLGLAAAEAQRLDTIPSQLYYAGVQEVYSGNFRDAQRTFARCLTGAVKTLNQGGGTIRWIDSICYYTMLGETFYQWGQPDKALAQFDLACSLYLQYPKWMLRVQFDAQPVADMTLARTAIPWGASQRRSTPGRFTRGMPVAQGSFDVTQQIQQGGAIMQPQFWTVDVLEVNRCAALAIRRRNEILGPLGAHDAISKNLVTTLGRGGAPPNHWSNLLIDIQRGLALAGTGESEQALQLLERGVAIGGQLDHPLTAVALLEQGRLAMQTGNFAAAAGLFAEASYSAYLFQDYNVIDDAFRYGEMSRMAGDAQGVNPALAMAQVWARRERLDFVGARLSLAIADELLNQGDVKNAAAALSAASVQLHDAKTGYLGNWAMYLEARLQFNQNRDSAAAVLATALEGQRRISLQNYQIGLANRMFDAQSLPTRSAGSVYEVLLDDPKPAETALRPLETMGVMSTSHEAAFDRWLLTALERKNIGAFLEISDRAKRRRFHNAQPWGGRLLTIRETLAAPAALLAADRQQQQQDILSHVPDYAAANGTVDKLHSELAAVWRPPLDAEAQKKSARLWDSYSAAVAARERMLARIASSRLPAEYAFPPFKAAAELQQRLEPGQALLVFHDTSDGLMGLAVTGAAANGWNCGPSQKLAPLIAQFLRDCGNLDPNREVATDELAAGQWQKSGEALFKVLFEGASIDFSTVKELVIVPDGLTWYLPFEALIAHADNKSAPLIGFCKTRYAPTAALAFSFEGAWRRPERTGIAAGDLVPGDKPQERLEMAAALEAAVDGALPLQNPLPTSSPIVATLLDSLIVLDDIETQGDPLEICPLPLDKAPQQGALENWLALPDAGPQRVALPGLHTPAERGGKVASRSRKGGPSAGLGDELFFTSCSLIASGAETVLLSRWRVGGQSTLDLVREFMQELPQTAAAESWQRSVELAKERPIDPATELHLKPGKAASELTGAHPYFWAGYLVVDTGWNPKQSSGKPAQLAAAPKPGEVAAAKPAEATKAADENPPAPASRTAKPAAKPQDALAAPPNEEHPAATETPGHPKSGEVPPPPTPPK